MLPALTLALEGRHFRGKGALLDGYAEVAHTTGLDGKLGRACLARAYCALTCAYMFPPTCAPTWCAPGCCGPLCPYMCLLHTGINPMYCCHRNCHGPHAPLVTSRGVCCRTNPCSSCHLLHPLLHLQLYSLLHLQLYSLLHPPAASFHSPMFHLPRWLSHAVLP